MPEEQADYDTTSDTDPAQPTAGPWEAVTIEKEGTWVDVEGEEVEVARMSIPGKEGVANARLIAAAGTAASKLSEEYDPVAVVEALPSLITVLQSVERANATKKEELIMAQNHAKQLLDTLRKEALASDTTQTDE